MDNNEDIVLDKDQLDIIFKTRSLILASLEASDTILKDKEIRRIQRKLDKSFGKVIDVYTQAGALNPEIQETIDQKASPEESSLPVHDFRQDALEKEKTEKTKKANKASSKNEVFDPAGLLKDMATNQLMAQDRIRKLEEEVKQINDGMSLVLELLQIMGKDVDKIISESKENPKKEKSKESKKGK